MTVADRLKSNDPDPNCPAIHSLYAPTGTIQFYVLYKGILKKPLIYSVLPASGGENTEKMQLSWKNWIFQKFLYAKISAVFK